MNKNFGKFTLIFISVLAACIIAIYCAFLFILHAVVNSDRVITALETKIARTTPFKPHIKGLTYKPRTSLSSELAVQSVTIFDHKNNKLISAEDIYLKFQPFLFLPEKIKINYLFADINKFSNIRFNKSTEGKTKFKLKRIPEIAINSADITINNSTGISLNNLSGTSNNNKYVINFNSVLKTNYLKHNITTASNGCLTYQNGRLSAENFRFNIENSQINLNGKLFDNKKHYDFTVTGAGIPVRSIEEGVLFFIRQKKPEKNFIENFYDFSGNTNLNLKISNECINGKVLIKNLHARTVKYGIPILLPSAEFNFSGSEISASATGKFGNKDIFTDFSAKKLFTPDKIIYGSVNSTLDDKFTSLYTPEINISGKITALVKYQIHNGNITVEYTAGIPEGSNIYYRNADLGLTNNDRQIYAKTVKQKNNLYLQNYDYSFITNGKTDKIILGNGLFVKENGKFRLDYITCSTQGEAPVSITGSFGKYIEGGTFSGDMKYYYPKNILTGNIFLHNSKYKDFFVKEASIIANSDNMKIKADGMYNNSDFHAFIDMKNSFNKEITVYNMDLSLNEYILKRETKKHTKQKIKLPDNPKNIKFTIRNGVLTLNKFMYNKILLENLKLIGSLKNNTVEFSMPDIDFANGKLSASGTFDIDNLASDIYFSAAHIDSNIAASMIFNLQDQIEGFANAKMHLKTFNKIEYINAHTDFSIENGALTKIGSTEFIIKKNKGIKKTLKFKIPDIINIDIKKMSALKANINGCLDIHNHKIKNIKIYSKHKYLSLFTEGSYNIRKQDANIQVWGKYNRSAQKGIRILFVPLSLITKVILRPEYTRAIYQEKIDMVPSIDAKSSEEEDFTVRMTGNLNDSSSVKVELKSIR